MAAKADSRLPASLTAYASCTHPLGHVQESLWGFATGQAHATLLCLALELILGEGQFGSSVLCSLVLQFTELISPKSRWRSHPRGIQFPE